MAFLKNFIILMIIMIGMVSGVWWPISKSTTPDLPQSNHFGPRIQVADNFIYDWHRGIDIPTPFNTSVYSIADGIVRLAGNYSGWQDTVIQVTHDEISQFGSLYSTNLHMNLVFVNKGQSVTRGQLLGTSGMSTSGFQHLHFEIRQFSFLNQYAVNPWKYLPYTNTNNLSVDSVTLDFVARNVTIDVSGSPKELDFAGFVVKFLDAGLNELATILRFDIEEFSRSTGDVSVLDDNIISMFKVQVFPKQFFWQGATPQRNAYSFVFYDVVAPVGTKIVRITLFDAKNFTNVVDHVYIPKCFGILANESSVCSGRGPCTYEDTCACTGGYGGLQCQSPICFNKLSTDPSVCSGRAACTSPNICACPAGYYGSECEVSTCFGMISTDLLVCNGSGLCIAIDTCACFNTSQFTGSYCQVPLCSGKNASDSTVCTGVGFCSGNYTSTPVCTCKAEFSGPNCEIAAFPAKARQELLLAAMILIPAVLAILFVTTFALFSLIIFIYRLVKGPSAATA